MHAYGGVELHGVRWRIDAKGDDASDLADIVALCLLPGPGKVEPIRLTTLSAANKPASATIVLSGSGQRRIK
jgi:hypothetical protein